MKRRDFISGIAAAGAWSMTGCSTVFNTPLDTRHPTPDTRHPTLDTRHPPAPSPNILLVMVDDMGYSDIGCYGGEIQTPTIDALAHNGVRLSRFYNCAQCCPSRASLLTGLYPHQVGMGDMNDIGPTNKFWSYVGSDAYLGFKTDGVVTTAEALKQAGYQTFMSGKWHIGHPEFNWPVNRGFDRSFALLHGASEHFSGRPSWKSSGPIAPFLLDDKKLESLPDDFYSSDTFTDYALKFIDESQDDKPWFCYLAFTAPHWPIQAHEKDIAKYRGTYKDGPEAVRRRRFERQKEMGLVPPDARLPEIYPLEESVDADRIAEWERTMETYAAMIDCVDQNLARVIQRLKQRGELDHTLILFVSDNGSDTFRGPRWGQVSNAPFHMFKVWTHDGGIGTPFIAHWPKAIPAKRNGTLIHGYGHFIDVHPTCLDAANAKQPERYNGHDILPPEGISLLPMICGRENLPNDRPIFWERKGNEGVRRGAWKLVRGYVAPTPQGKSPYFADRTGEWELYNVERDPGETRNLINPQPALAAELKALYERWADRVGVIPHERIAELHRDFIEGKPKEQE